MKLNFDQVMIYSSIDRKQGEIKNIRKAFANFIYTEENGILARAIANKIFNATDETDFTPEECFLIRQYCHDLTPNYIDAIEEMLDDAEAQAEEQTDEKNDE